MSNHKTIVSGEEARAKIRSAVDTVANVVRATLGPAGRNVLLLKHGRKTRVINDGVTAAEETLPLKDPAENAVARGLVEVSRRTNDVAGDGTTTAMTLAQKIVHAGMRRLESGSSILAAPENVMELRREINEQKEKVIAALKEMATPIETQEQTRQVATASMEDPEMGRTIADMLQQVGKDGFVTVEEGFKTETETEVTKGLRFHGTYIAPFMATNERKEAIVNEWPILVTNFEIEDPQALGPIAALLVKGDKAADIPPRRNVIVIASKWGKTLPASLWATLNLVDKEGNPRGFSVLAIKAPSLTEDMLEDVATYVGAKFFDKKKDMKLKDLTLEDFGKADKVIVTMDDVVMLGGAGDQDEIDKRVEKLRAQHETEKTDLFKKKLERRIATLAGGIGIIRVGAHTEVERGYLKMKIEDAVNATKAALEEGVVPGGGLALKAIAKTLPKDSILAEALNAPYEQIKENAGGGEDYEVPENVLDPVKVTRTAVEMACEVSSMLLTTEAIIVEAEDDVSKLREILTGSPE